MKKKEITGEIQRFNPTNEFGLSDSEVLYMKQNGKVNNAKNPTNKSYFAIVFGNIFTGFNILMFAIAAVLLIIVGPKVITNLMFLIIIFTNILIGTIQECKSKHTIEKLKLLNDTKVKVRRNGSDVYIHPQEVVLDDIICLSPGDQISVDCIIVEDGMVEVNESILTGESAPVKKRLGQQLFAGSFIVAGSVYARADKVGGDTYIASIEKKAKSAKQVKSKLMLAIAKVIRIMAIIAIPTGFIVFVNEFLQSLPKAAGVMPIFPTKWGEDSVMTNAVFYGGTAIAYMIPTGMALLASVAMATGVVKLAQYKTLAADLYSVESLSRVNTLCLDKTGTLTDGTMMLDRFEILTDKYEEDEISLIMSSYLSSFKSANQTSTALLTKFGNVVEKKCMTLSERNEVALLDQFKEKNRLKVINSIEFSSARKFSAVEFKDRGWFILGAPEYLSKDETILNKVKECATHGLRVILLAKVEGEVSEDAVPDNKEVLAMFVLRDNIRSEVKDTMIWFRNNDVDIKVISGDNVGTVSYISKQCGIENWDKVFDMSTLKPEDDLEEIVLNNSIFGRVTPDQKADIVAILKKHDRVVGVTGDGVNDLLAFKQADCSIALANGVAATKNVANLILLDSNFANMKEAVFQGRRVVNNIQRSSSLFVMKDFLWFFITILPILLGIPHITQPTVMTIVNIFITGIASLFISLEPDKTRVQGNFFKNVVESAVLSAFFMFIPVLLLFTYVILQQVITTGSYNVSSMETVVENNEIVQLGWLPLMALCITIAGFVVFFHNCRPFTKFRKILFTSITIVVVIVLYLAPEYFIVSGTQMLKEVAPFIRIPEYVITHLDKNANIALYKTITLEQWLFLLGYCILVYPSFIFTQKIFSKLVDKVLFSKREYLDY